MSSNLDDIQKAISELKMDNEFKLLNKTENLLTFNELENRFVNKEGLRWWWEDFKLPYQMLEGINNPWETINLLVPSKSQKVLLMIENDSKIYPIFECNPDLIPTVINECLWFEYYIIDKEQNWLICENHHNEIYLTGSLVNEKTKHNKA